MVCKYPLPVRLAANEKNETKEKTGKIQTKHIPKQQQKIKCEGFNRESMQKFSLQPRLDGKNWHASGA